MNWANPSPAELESELINLQTMLKTEGWKLYDKFLQVQESQLLRMLFDAKDAHSLAVASGALKAVTDLRAWPDRQITSLRNFMVQPQSG